MFNDARSKNILLVSHCILNQNSVSDGTAEYPGINEIITKKLLDSNIGIIQMPSPEIMCLGLDRRDIHGGQRQIVVENTRIRNELEKSDSIRTINNLVDQVMLQINEYIKNGFQCHGNYRDKSFSKLWCKYDFTKQSGSSRRRYFYKFT